MENSGHAFPSQAEVFIMISNVNISSIIVTEYKMSLRFLVVYDDFL